MGETFGFQFEERTVVCPKHGEVKVMCFPDFKGAPKCPKCEDERESERSESERRLADEARWTASNVKPKFFWKSFSDYKVGSESQGKALALVQDIAEGGDRSLVLCGNNGTGKTMLASLAVMQRGGRIFKMYEIVMRIKASYKASAKEDERDILKELSTAPLLVIDEVGKQFGSDSERNWLSYVIDERYEEGRPTILISNLKAMRDCSEEEKAQGFYLERYLGRDSVSRLAETADIILVEGEDYRRKKS